MDTQLKELIDRIKTDGIRTAEQNADRIISQAKEQAAAILKDAEENARNLRQNALADAEKFEQSGQAALRQAGRDLILTLKSEIEKMFNAILRRQTSKALDSDTMKEAVIAAVKNLSEAQGLEIQIPEKELAAVESGLTKVLADQMAKGVEIVPFKELDAGFRISLKDGTAFYDFSDTEISAMLAKHLNPRLGQLITE